MADQRLVDYIRHSLKQNVPINQLEKALIKEGWSKWDVNGAIDVIVEEKEKGQFMNEPYTMQGSSRMHTNQSSEAVSSPDQNYPEQNIGGETTGNALKSEDNKKPSNGNKKDKRPPESKSSGNKSGSKLNMGLVVIIIIAIIFILILLDIIPIRDWLFGVF
jgi:hypothetical protein